MQFGTCIEINFACDTCKAPEVLVLEIGTVTPAHHLHGNQVFARFEIFGDVEFSSNLAVFAIAYILTVDPKSQVACSRTYVEIYVFAFPICGKVECATVRTGIVVGLADIRRIGVKLSCPRIAHVFIGGITVTVQFEKSGNGEVFPL